MVKSLVEIMESTSLEQPYCFIGDLFVHVCLYQFYQRTGVGRANISGILGTFSTSAITSIQEGYECGVLKLKLQERIGLNNFFF